MTMRQLPPDSDRRYLVFTGTGTDLIFNHGIALPGFASFPLLSDPKVRPILAQQMRELIDVAHAAGLGAILDTPTWTANRDRAAPLGYTEDQLDDINRDAIRLMRGLRDETASDDVLLALSLGPARDPYGDDSPLDVATARGYHRRQIGIAQAEGVDLVHAYTFNQINEAAGVVLAARDVGLPVVVSLVVETDGALRDGTQLDAAIHQIDDLTDAAASYFMVNCAHPDHFRDALSGNPRLKGIVANASRCSHAELDEATELDDGNPEELGEEIATLASQYPELRVIGGCCGTDMRHLGQIAKRLGS